MLLQEEFTAVCEILYSAPNVTSPPETLLAVFKPFIVAVIMLTSGQAIPVSSDLLTAHYFEGDMNIRERTEIV